MANKALATRQKLMMRVEPPQKALKARNPIAPDAGQRFTASQRKAGLKGMPLQRKLLKKVSGNGGGD